MRIWTLLFAIALVGIRCPAPTWADDELLFDPPPARVMQPVGFVDTDLTEEAAEDTPDKANMAPSPPSRLPDDPAYGPGDVKPPKPLPGGLGFEDLEEPTDLNPFLLDEGLQIPPDAGDAGCPLSCGRGCKRRCADRGQCGGVCDGGCARKTQCVGQCDGGCDDGRCRRGRGCQPLRLFDSPRLKCHGLEVGGWLQTGFSATANNPADGYNGVVTFNDRDGEFQMNQFWMFIEREADTGGCGWNVGGRIDFVYGTDARFTQAADGLEANWNQTQRFYQAALPQFYLDVAYDDLTVRMGHFYTIIGYEVVQAPGNFFYSRAYTMQYGEPFTHTGLLAMYDLTDQVSINAGVHRGNDQFDDTDGLDALNFLGGATWTNSCEKLSLGFAISTTEDGPGVATQIYSLAGSWNVTDNLTYVIQHDCGQSTGLPNRNRSVEWYGINQYLLYQINTCWAAGLRFEWFRDDDGARVAGLGDGNLNTGPYVGNFYELTAGLNWKPHANLTFRPEVRWDWFDADLPGGQGPYDAGDRNSQFMFGCDLIVTF